MSKIMKVYPCSYQKLEILSVVDDETSDNRKFKKVEAQVHDYLNTDNGRIKWGEVSEVFFIWNELDDDFPVLEDGDIIEGEKLDLASFPEKVFLNR